jgi:tetratricopeptide (TPR) repeat protein
MLRRVLTELLRRRSGTQRPAAAEEYDGRHGRTLNLAAEAGTPAWDEERLRRQASMQPRDAEVHRQLGSLLGAGGRLDEAQRMLARSLELDPASAPALADMGNVLRMQGSTAQAEAYYRRALALDSGLSNTRLNLASLLEESAPEQSAALYLELAESAAHPLAVRGAITMLDRLDRAADARRLCERLIERSADDFEANRGLGFLLLKREFAAEAALVHLDRALAANPHDVETLANRGIALQDLGRVDDAIASYEDALKLSPDHEVARFHRALALLLRGDFVHGWDDYELRLATQDRPQRRFAAARWRGEDLSGKTLLVHAEQGLGDEIMFASCIPEAAALCQRLVLECSPKLAPLFARSFPQVTVHAGSQLDGTEALDALGADRVVPAGSLPGRFRRSLQSFPRHAGYLRADAERSRYYRARLDALGAGPKVGISWRGGTVRSRGPLRTLDPQRMSGILQVDGVHFLDLQYDSQPGELEPLRKSAIAVHTWPAALADYDETAALVSALDLVISVCTAVVHLGGALGRPVWVLAPFSPEWRYGIAGERMVWYPSVRIFRQETPGRWDAVLARVADELRDLCSRTSESTEESR